MGVTLSGKRRAMKSTLLVGILSLSGVWASTCSFKQNTAMSLDYYKNVRVSKSACCSLCASDARCRTAVYSPQGECHLHDAKDSARPFSIRGWMLMSKMETIVDLAVATPELSTLVTALKAADLVKTLSSKGPFTVFAPSNNAFAALPKGVLANLLKPENKAQLVDLLTYHVASGDVHAKDLVDMQMLKTVEGKNVTVRTVGKTIFIDSSKVTTADVQASNGVVHIIDAVLMPSNAPKPVSKTIVDLAVATPELSTLVTALKAADLVKTLSSKGPFTVFAPSNKAFAALPKGVLANLLKPENKAQLVDLLTYHVASGDVHAKDLMDMQMLPTVEGKNVTVRTEGNTILIDSSKVTTADVQASNGVVHIIDAVLMPSNA